eukprot:6889468-Pyramimonas_sp.AAC.1
MHKKVLFFTLRGKFDPATLTVTLVKMYQHPVPAELKVVSGDFGGNHRHPTLCDLPPRPRTYLSIRKIVLNIV